MKRNVAAALGKCWLLLISEASTTQNHCRYWGGGGGGGRKCAEIPFSSSMLSDTQGVPFRSEMVFTYIAAMWLDVCQSWVIFLPRLWYFGLAKRDL